MLKLATILDNPGEPPTETRFRDPQILKNLGYNGKVIYPTTGLSGLLESETIESEAMRVWVEGRYDYIDKLIQATRESGLQVWVNYDAPSLARELISQSTSCSHQPDVLCPASDEMLSISGRCLERMLSRFDPVDGVVLRVGDNDAHRLGYLVGNDIYSPHCAKCSSVDRIERLVRYIQFFYNLVVKKLGRSLIVRAWNVRPGGLHDQPDLCRKLLSKLPKDDKLILSFKFTHTDFWRYQAWNPSSLVCGDRPVIYELQCQREFEGKGGIPNYQASLWRDGMPECEESIGLAEVSSQVNFAGVWAWVRGGGWGGPFVTHENWIDANVWSVPRLADNPTLNVTDLAKTWISDQLGYRNRSAAEAILQTLENSPTSVLESFYIGPYARLKKDPWYPAGHFIQDDLLDAEAGWSIVRRLPENVLEEVIHEKQRAVERLARDRHLLQQASSKFGDSTGEGLVNSMLYAESFAEAIRDLISGMVSYRRMQGDDDPGLVRRVQKRLRACQSSWNHHTQRYSGYTGTATAFRSENLWDFTQAILDETIG